MGDGDRWQTASDESDDSRHDDSSEEEPTVEPGVAAPTDSGGLGRRELLAAGGIAAAGAGGWYVFLRDDGQSGPTAVSEQNWRAWKNGNAEAYRTMFHSESPEREAAYWSDDEYWANFGPEDDVTLTLVSSEVVEESGDRAVVEEVYHRDAPDAQTEAITTEVELRTENGEWKLWRIQFISSDPVDGSN